MGSAKPPDAVELHEPFSVPDIFVEGIGRIERLSGGNLRFVLYAQQEAPDGRKERIVVAKLVGPVVGIPAVLRQITEAIAGAANWLGDLLN